MESEIPFQLKIREITDIIIGKYIRIIFIIIFYSSSHFLQINPLNYPNNN